MMDRVESVSQMIAKERSVREVHAQNMERQIQGVRDALESERSVRRQEAAAVMSMQEDVKHELELAARIRSTSEEKIEADLFGVNERINELSARIADARMECEE